jgi:hypothetical protein
MKQANCRCFIDKGWDVPLSNVTPAEVLVLTVEHQKGAGKPPIEKIEEVAGVERTAGDEVARLKNKYGAEKVSKLFAGAIPTLPQTFKEAVEVGMKTSLPQSGLGSFVIKQ